MAAEQLGLDFLLHGEVSIVMSVKLREEQLKPARGDAATRLEQRRVFLPDS